MHLMRRKVFKKINKTYQSEEYIVHGVFEDEIRKNKQQET